MINGYCHQGAEAVFADGPGDYTILVGDKNVDEFPTKDRVEIMAKVEVGSQQQGR